jgi:hypothetical protein
VRPRVTSSLLWGAVGALAFLALAQAYQLLVARLGFGLPALLGVGVVVGALVAAVTYLTEVRLTAKGRT